jgi:cob(I)alamin adenosyltransferase
MSIYSRHGDRGRTRCLDGSEVDKTHPLVTAVGDVEALGARIGLCRCLARRAGSDVVDEQLRLVQRELFALGEPLASAARKPPAPPQAVDETTIRRIEQSIDKLWGQLPPLEHFVLPDGCELACQLHLARCDARRAERSVVALNERVELPGVILVYLNRLGDLLFVLARRANREAGFAEETWSA